MKNFLNNVDTLQIVCYLHYKEYFDGLKGLGLLSVMDNSELIVMRQRSSFSCSADRLRTRLPEPLAVHCLAVWEGQMGHCSL